jgi:hypothetical protein
MESRQYILGCAFLEPAEEHFAEFDLWKKDLAKPSPIGGKVQLQRIEQGLDSRSLVRVFY